MGAHFVVRSLTILLIITASVACVRVWSASSYAQSSSGQFANGFPDDPRFFPIGVWVQDPQGAAAYKAMGVNTFVGLWKGPTEVQLSQLAKAGVYAIADQNDLALHSPNAHVIKAWMQDDEPDNAQPRLIGGHGDCVRPEQVVSTFSAMRSRDPTRPVFLNFGQGVANKQWRGRGRLCNSMDHDLYYRQASRGADILSFDIYPVTESRQPHIQGRLELVADGVSNLVRWAVPEQRVWALIGTTHISDPSRRPTPAEIRAMAWMALIKGARGLVYFVHEWHPTFGSSAIFRYPEIVAAVTLLNSEIRELAPVINSANVVSIKASPDIAAMARGHGDILYVFAVNLSNKPRKAKLTLDGGQTGAGGVVGETRPVSLKDGVLDDDFEPYGARLYAFPQR